MNTYSGIVKSITQKENGKGPYLGVVVTVWGWFADNGPVRHDDWKVWLGRSLEAQAANPIEEGKAIVVKAVSRIFIFKGARGQ